MKKIISYMFLMSIVVLGGCNRKSSSGQLQLPNTKRWFEPTPLGMEFIPRGVFNIGPSDQDIENSNSPSKTVSVEAFWMDDTEITNNEYRQFVQWVRDSIARTLLSERNPDFMISQDRKGNQIDPPRINWKEKLDWSNPDYKDVLEPMFVPENERFFKKHELDARKLFYAYYWIDLKQAARRVNMYNYENQSYNGSVIDTKGEEKKIENRSSFIFSNQVNVYPDTLCWIRDFTFSYNEPWTKFYFWHPAFDNYPIVGVTWKQAKAFCNWRTKLHNDYLASRRDATLQDYRLPTEVEWEYAARGKHKNSMYPWGGYYTRNKEGVLRANFKPLRGNYIDDGGMATMAVGSFSRNDFCLYDMAGNVAEWTSSAFDESSYMYINDFNPDFEYDAKTDDPPVMKRKVVRGGSWKDVASFLQVSTRSFEYQDTAKSYIGFRCVRSSFGSEFYVNQIKN